MPSLRNGGVNVVLIFKCENADGCWILCTVRNVCSCAVNNGYLCTPEASIKIRYKTWHNNAHIPVSLISLFLTMVDPFVEPR